MELSNITRDFATSQVSSSDDAVPPRRVIILTDSTLQSVEFRVNGFIYKSGNMSAPPAAVYDESDYTLPWIGQFILFNISANKGWPANLVKQELSSRYISADSIDSVFVAIGLKDERERRMYRTKSMSENGEEACKLVEAFLLEAADNFPNAQVTWLGLGKLKSTAKRYNHIENIVSVGLERSWPERIHFFNIFQQLENVDIKNLYGHLNTLGSKKIINRIEKLLRKWK